jgi:hypothetical protein
MCHETKFIFGRYLLYSFGIRSVFSAFQTATRVTHFVSAVTLRLNLMHFV